MLAQRAKRQRAVFEDAVMKLADVEGVAKLLFPRRSRSASSLARNLATASGELSVIAA
jgi:hypothetical protein